MADSSLLRTSLDNTLKHFQSFPVQYQWITVGLATFVLWNVKGYLDDRRAWANVPVVGSSPLTRWLSPLMYLFYGNRWIQEGYSKYKPGAFRIKQFGKWTVFVTSPNGVDEVRRYPDEILSSIDAINDDLETEWTFGKRIADNPYHVPVIRSQLTQNLANVFPVLTEEMAMAFEHYIKATPDDWTPVKTDLLMKVVSRMSNRVFVGAPICRNEEYLDVTIKFTIDVFLGAQVLKMFPSFMKPFIRRYVTTVPKRLAMGAKHLVPYINERLKMIKENGDNFDGTPNDLLSWLIDDARGEEQEAVALCHRVLTVNVAAIHTTSLSFTNVLYHLAAYGDKYAEPMREEVIEAIRKEGWTKVTMTKCRKMDSFVKECFRLKPLGSVSMSRMAMQPVTLSDGTGIPKGAILYTVATPMHKDPEIYGENAEEFDGFRFSDIRSGSDAESLKHQAVSLTPEYLVFGYGKHACPGRFFAVNEMKAMLAHVLLNYDVKFAPEMGLKYGEVPKSMDIGNTTGPNQSAVVLFRKRENSMSAY